jgi:hypothetical protein
MDTVYIKEQLRALTQRLLGNHQEDNHLARYEELRYFNGYVYGIRNAVTGECFWADELVKQLVGIPE